GCPTLITLSDFSATAGSRKVILNWSTSSEIDNAGFNLYRAEAGTEGYVKINSALIPAKGSSTEGATYKFVDREAKRGQAYAYKLEDVDQNGQTTLHGPVEATAGRLFGFKK
ncbi:MAG: hypothetical protein GY868_04910, partial [Deltaproteobacteria bacterium]|nr:hypothetical protein [Deltaproteobacteria bacterium]